MANLKPCPFCGGEVKLTQFGNELTKKRGFYVRCRECAVELRQEAVRYTLDWLRPKVVEMWNRRALPASVRALVDANQKIMAALATPGAWDSKAATWLLNDALSAVLAEFPELKEARDAT